MPGKVIHDASITVSEEENDEGFMQTCVYATCLETDEQVGPIWGDSHASVKRALATLTEESGCGADFHRYEADV